MMANFKIPRVETPRSFATLTLIVFTISIFLIYLRFEGPYFPGKFLWAEDGNIFINQAAESGFYSLFESYAGYLHLYPRIVAIITNPFDLRIQEFVFISAWAIAFLMTVGILMHRALHLGFNALEASTLVLAVSLQPVHHEIFFNITNAQWILGLGLFIFFVVQTDEQQKTGWVFCECIFLIFASLSSVFSIIIIPILLFRLIFEETSLQQKMQCFLVLFCGIVQFIVLLTSPRLTDTANVLSVYEIVRATMYNIKTVPLVASIAFIFWISLGAAIIFNLRSNFPRVFPYLNTIFLLGLAWGSIIVVVTFASNLANAAPFLLLKGGTRYTWIPDSLLYFALVFSAVRLRQRNSLPLFRRSLFVVLGSVVFANVSAAKRFDLQLDSFAAFAKIHTIKIPINPPVKVFPGLYITKVPTDGLGSADYYDYVPAKGTIEARGGALEITDGEILFQTNGARDGILYIDRLTCDYGSHIGLEFDIVRAKPGQVKVSWSSGRNLPEVGSLERFYPNGRRKMHFAFPRLLPDTYVHLTPSDGPSLVRIQRMRVFCLR